MKSLTALLALALISIFCIHVVSAAPLSSYKPARAFNVHRRAPVHKQRRCASRPQGKSTAKPTSTSAAGVANVEDVPTPTPTQHSTAKQTPKPTPATVTILGGEGGASDPTSNSGGARFAVYADNWLSEYPTPDDLGGWNVFYLSFWTPSSGPVDNALGWSQLDASKRQSILQSYNNAGIKLMVSAFGSTEAPTSNGNDPTKTAHDLAAFVKAQGLHGADIDYEDFAAMNAGTGAAEEWLITFTKALRAALPSPQYTITHAPVAPWFQKGRYNGGGYLKVHQQAGNLIDWYNVQFYNQGNDEYTQCAGLFTKSTSANPGTSVFEIADNGVPLDKIVVGKVGSEENATNGGFMPAAELGTCVKQAVEKGWKAGVMAWQWPTAGASFIGSVRKGVSI